MYVFISASTDSIIKNKDRYSLIVDVLESHGYKNSNKYLSHMLTSKNLEEDNIHRNTLKSIKQSTFIIVDISFPSLTLGSQIEYAIMNNIPVLCLCEDVMFDDGPVLLKYYENKLLSFTQFNTSNLKTVLEEYVKNFKRQKIKFNVFITPEIDRYLKWYGNKNHMSKSDVFRFLIKKQIKDDQDYK